MIWDEEVVNIVMVTNLKEGGKIKAHQYWPKSGRKNYGVMSVFLKKEVTSECGSYVKRVFKITKGDKPPGSSLRKAAPSLAQVTNEGEDTESKTIIQYHFIGWPDFGVPEGSDGLLNLIADLDNFRETRGYTRCPIVVHCSAGVGRTGTFIMIHSFIQLFKTQGFEVLEEDFSISDALVRMRLDRDKSIQKETQYNFCYRTLFRYFDWINGIDEAETIAALEEQDIRLRKKKKKKRN
eukprot:TRINITY_DN4890_c0_g1_i2.p1 TRINITY_DN4890_c0_g1~~TRINITY_DN4890_c0_g1_i2.p1  ORF type:complete len:237 (-),score=41.13 TRINITY_DN4890_c0_g1_i2:2-712(-)